MNLTRKELREILSTRKDILVAEEAASTFEIFCKKRLENMPVQYIVGEWDFHDLRGLHMRKTVLIPRPETEELVDFAAEILRPIVQETASRPVQVLDIGAGTGAIGLALLNVFPSIVCVACDVSPVAVDLANENAKRFGFSDRYRCVRSDIANLTQTFPDMAGSFDAIVSNPPYIPSADMSSLQTEVDLGDEMEPSSTDIVESEEHRQNSLPKKSEEVMVSFESKYYRAFIVDIADNSVGDRFKVHYRGWNKKHDEWVPISRISTIGTVSRTALTGNVGRRVKKYFADKAYEGKVIAHDPENGFWKILYDDCDQEDVSDDELSKIILDEHDRNLTCRKTASTNSNEGRRNRRATKDAPTKHICGFGTFADAKGRGREKRKSRECATRKSRGRATKKSRGCATDKSRERATKIAIAPKVERACEDDDVVDVPERVWVKWRIGRREEQVWYECRVVTSETGERAVVSFENANPAFEGCYAFLPFGRDKRGKKADHIWCRRHPRDFELGVATDDSPVVAEARRHVSWLSGLALSAILNEIGTCTVLRRVCFQLIQRWYGYALDIQMLTWSQILNMHRNASATSLPTLTSIRSEISRKTRVFTLRSSGDAFKHSMELSRRQDLLVVGDGFGRLVRWLRGKLPDSAVALNSAVSCVDTRNASHVRVTCASGATCTARQVVVTLPIGTMRYSADNQHCPDAKKGAVRFLPPLSSRRCDALRSAPIIANHEKIALCYARTFWGRRALRKGEAGYNSRATEDGGRRFIASTDERWGSITNMDAFRRAATTTTASGAIILGHVFPPNSKTATSECGPEAFHEHLTSLFDAPPDIRPTDKVATSWGTDPFARCSYTEYAALDAKTSKRLVAALSEPKQGCVHFAGEHAIEDNGNVAGAYTSGLMRADDVLACFDAKEGATDTDLDVLVVGAGIAGLAAAAEIHARRPDLRLRVLEARDRLGGRVWTESMRCADGSTQNVELGASYIHGFKYDPKSGASVTPESLPRTLSMAACAAGVQVAKVESGHWEPILSALWRPGDAKETSVLSTEFVLTAAALLVRILNRGAAKRAESEWAYDTAIARALNRCMPSEKY
eukprot:g851.t1